MALAKGKKNKHWNCFNADSTRHSVVCSQPDAIGAAQLPVDSWGRNSRGWTNRQRAEYQHCKKSDEYFNKTEREVNSQLKGMIKIKIPLQRFLNVIKNIRNGH